MSNRQALTPSNAVLPYTRTARILHWLTAGLLVGSYGLGISMTRWIDDDQMLRVYGWHEWIGVTVFGLVVARLVWRVGHPPPALDVPRLERGATAIIETAMYVILIAQPVTGWLMSTAFGFPVVYLGWLPLPQPVPADGDLAEALQRVHAWLGLALLALIAAHLGRVLYHHLIRRDGLLLRMLPSAGTGDESMPTTYHP